MNTLLEKNHQILRLELLQPNLLAWRKSEGSCRGVNHDANTEMTVVKLTPQRQVLVGAHADSSPCSTKGNQIERRGGEEEGHPNLRPWCTAR